MPSGAQRSPTRAEARRRHEPLCEACGRSGAKARCGGCKKVFFCDATCQRRGWAAHRGVCGKASKKAPKKAAKPAKAAKAPAPDPEPEAPTPASKPPPTDLWGEMVSDLGAKPEAPAARKPMADFVPMSASRPFGFGARRF